jgi:hypothetical protein
MSASHLENYQLRGDRARAALFKLDDRQCHDYVGADHANA